MIRRWLAWDDRTNPLRGRSPADIFFQTLLTYGILVGLLWLVDGDDRDLPLWIGVLVGYSIRWFTWVWRA